MIVYIINSVLCSTSLIAAYYLFLEGEKVHHFKRWYLLSTLIASLLAPLLTIQQEQSQFATPISNITEHFTVQTYSIEQGNMSTLSQSVTNTAFNWVDILLVGYGIITSILLFRVFRNLFLFFSDAKGKSVVCYQEATVVLHNDYTIPHSFLHYIFISAQDYSNNQILLHELTHIRQRHSLDILLVEFVHCIMWFNPAIIFYKKAIRLNHEFLADEVVLKNYSTTDYQNLLLQKTQLSNQRSLASSFNYSATKKRFIMMTTLKNQTRATIKIMFSVVLITCAVLVFQKKTYAQNPPQVIPAFKNSPEQDGPGATAEMVTEFDSLIYKYIRVKKSNADNTSQWYDITGITKEEKSRMREIYNLMTGDQKSKYPKESRMIFFVTFTPPRKNPPTPQDMKDFADPTVYGIWLDGKRIDNAELAKYQATDISHVFKSRLLKNAAHYGQYKFQIDLMTQEYFDKTYPPQFK